MYRYNFPFHPKLTAQPHAIKRLNPYSVTFAGRCTFQTQQNKPKSRKALLILMDRLLPCKGEHGCASCSLVTGFDKLGGESGLLSSP